MMTAAMTAPARAGADLRLLRAAVFAAACVALSAAGHEMASGEAIPVWALLAGWAGVLAVAAALAGRERTLPGIAALMVAGQVALHLLFSTGQASAAPAPAGGGHADRVMALAGRLVCGQVPPLTPDGAARLVRHAGIDPASAPAVAPGTGWMHGMPGMPGMNGAHGAMGYTLPMLCWHLVAAVVAGWLLRRGEAALWRLVRLSARGAGRVAARSPLGAALAAMRALTLIACRSARRAVPRRQRDRERAADRPRSAALRHSVVRRGPPRCALAA
jgi:hypothetical protein